MQPAWSASWCLGLVLIALTIAVHALGIVMIARVLRRSYQIARRAEQDIRRPTAIAAALIGLVGMLLAILHGFEAAVWAVAYLWLGAIVSERDAILYSVDSITTRGASGLVLDGQWRLMGALESADGMLLFGISTAFMFTVLTRITIITDRIGEVRR
jgi:hypothetical protein